MTYLPDTKNEWQELCTLPNGHTLYVKDNILVGGRMYMSDEIDGTGCFVWDTAIVDETTLLAAIVEEHRFRIEEHYENFAAHRREQHSDSES